MNPVKALTRWLRFRAVIDPARPGKTLEHDLDAVRRRQRTAARQAFLTTLHPGQHVLTGPNFGDTQ